MIGNVLKVIATLIVGFFVGLLFGVVIGVVLGIPIGFFFREIVYSHQTILMSIILSLILGGLLGSFAIQIINKIFETNDKPFIGALVGAVVGFIVIFFYGVIDIPNPDVFNQNFYFIPVPYSVSVGGQIGSIIYPIFGAAGIIRDIVKSYVELRKNKERENESKNELSFYRSKSNIDNKK